MAFSVYRRHGKEEKTFVAGPFDTKAAADANRTAASKREPGWHYEVWSGTTLIDAQDAETQTTFHVGEPGPGIPENQARVGLTGIPGDATHKDFTAEEPGDESRRHGVGDGPPSDKGGGGGSRQNVSGQPAPKFQPGDARPDPVKGDDAERRARERREQDERNRR